MSSREPTSRHDPVSAISGAAAGMARAARTAGQTARNAFGRRPGGGHVTQQEKIASAPGIEFAANAQVPPAAGEVAITVTDFSGDQIDRRTFDDVEALLTHERPEWATCRWINIDGLHPYAIRRISEAFDIHTLAAEDVFHVPQRPKLESFENHVFIVMRMLTLDAGKLCDEQVSLFAFSDLLITFQERPGDVWNPVRARLDNAGGRMRTHGVDYLLYALLDAVVDHLFPILENYGERMEDLEIQALRETDQEVQQKIFNIKRELNLLRRTMWPLREIFDRLVRDDDKHLTKYVKNYMRDVYDHAVQVLEMVETYREMAGGIQDLYMSTVSNKMNEVMKVLTIMASFFIPTTFVAGVYGMNFEHMPELDYDYAYPLFWFVIGSMFLGMFIFFWKKGWLGK